MKMILATLTLLFGLIFFFGSCQRVEDDDFSGAKESDMVKLLLHVSPFSQTDFSSPQKISTRTVDVSTLCSKLSFAFYRKDKLDTIITQNKTDSCFGTLEVSLKHGAYKLLILAHGSIKQPDMTYPERVNFEQENMSDVLYWYGDVMANDDSSYNIALHRAVAKVNITSQDNLPDRATQVYLWFSGGSYVFDAINGKAAYATDDYKLISIAGEDRGKPLDVSLYTFPNGEGVLSEIRMMISDKNGNIIEAKTFNNVPVRSNAITRLSGTIGK